MKSFLTGLSALVLGTGVLPAIANINTDNNIQITREKDIVPPVNSLLTTAGDWGTARKEWTFASINLGSIRQEQIINITSPYYDSYTEHKVDGYNYYKKDITAGITTGSNFRKYFQEGRAQGIGIAGALQGAYQNFYSTTSWGAASHTAEGTIKFMWWYDLDNNLIIDIVGTLSVYAYLSLEEGVA